jgi:hypothetical protein
MKLKAPSSGNAKPGRAAARGESAARSVVVGDGHVARALGDASGDGTKTLATAIEHAIEKAVEKALARRLATLFGA